MGDIKITISNLCKHLNMIFDMKLKPEMFRLAKFNKADNELVETFWILLSNIINLPASEEIVLDIKRYFFTNLKYKSLQFYTLPEDMSHGSRELLLAFSYLLTKDYLDKHVKGLINKSFFNPNYQPKVNDTLYHPESYTFNMKLIKTYPDFENALQWIEGRIKNNKKIHLEYQNCFEKLSTKVCKISSVACTQSEQLSLPTILALSNTAYTKRFLEETENVSKIVDNHEQWLQQEHLFWDWMNSVLLERQKALPVVNLEELEKLIATLK